MNKLTQLFQACIFAGAAMLMGVSYADDGEKLSSTSDSAIVQNKVKPNYPLAALKEGIIANLSVEIRIDKNCSAKSVSIKSNDAKKYSELFEASTEIAIKKWQFNCKAQNPESFLMQEVSFNPDERVINILKAQGAIQTEIFDRPIPNYPQDALRNGNEATIVTHVLVDEKCIIRDIKFMGGYLTQGASTGSNISTTNKSKFELAIKNSIERWKLKGKHPFNGPVVLEQQFGFFIEGQSPRYKLRDDIGITELLSISKENSIGKMALDLTKGTCPLRLSFVSMQPTSPNRIQVIQNDVRLSQDLYDWLRKLELKDNYKLSFLGIEFALNIPCAMIQL